MDGAYLGAICVRGGTVFLLVSLFTALSSFTCKGVLPSLWLPSSPLALLLLLYPIAVPSLYPAAILICPP